MSLVRTNTENSTNNNRSHIENRHRARSQPQRVYVNELKIMNVLTKHTNTSSHIYSKKYCKFMRKVQKPVRSCLLFLTSNFQLNKLF